MFAHQLPDRKNLHQILIYRTRYRIMDNLATFRCKLCGGLFSDDQMSEEHYPARSVGNDDIVSLNIVKCKNNDSYFIYGHYIL